jgi:hypothetical protein
VINLPGARDRYGDILADTFNELREYMRDNVIAASQVTEEEPLRELRLPRDATTRLCFFSIPVELVSLYRSRVFPVVEEIGFVPVTADDVITPGDNVNAKIDALIDRASVMVVEFASVWTRAEYEMAVARTRGTDTIRSNRRPLEIIVVSSQSERVPASAQAYTVISRSSLLGEEANEFIDALAGALREVAAEMGLQQDWEAHRLLNAKEYRAAVISAMTLLESELRNRLDKPSWREVRRPASLRQLVDMAVELELIPPTARQPLAEWVRIRNEAVHTAQPISRHVAREIVEGVHRILNP